ncbi:MAG: phage holin family protein [Clostridia bacterium]|nr:phage holin family protein [Clostridia bacterium]
MENILDFVKPELLVLVVALYFVGVALKKSNVKDKYIPLILGLCGIVLALLWVLATSAIAGWQDGLMAAFTAIVQGIIVAGLSVYANQIYKQLGKTDYDEITDESEEFYNK